MTRVAFIVNGSSDSSMGHRAREFARRLAHEYDIRLNYRSPAKFRSILNFFKFLTRFRPDVSYVFDIAYSGVAATALYKGFFGNLLIIETGDAIYELARSTGSRGSIGLWLTKVLEQFALRVADKVVVRGTFHKHLLAEKGIDAVVIQDGVDVRKFAPRDLNGQRASYGLDNVLTVGLVGSSVWSEKLQMCYGWELLETLRLLKDQPVKGIIIGDGSGISHLKKRAKTYGIEDRILFWGHVPFEELDQKLMLIDVCLSTQTNDIVGKVRTTGKLPLYMAAGRYILASDVGEASMVLDKEMLISYEGVNDNRYPERLAERIRELALSPDKVRAGSEQVVRASVAFDYAELAERMRKVMHETACTRMNQCGTRHNPN